MDDTLMAISKDQLENFRDYRKKGEEIANRIFERLEAKSKYGIYRHKMAGSIGKRTALGVGTKPDFDLVVFVNDQKPPFDDDEGVIAEFENILSSCKDLVILGSTRHCLQLRAKDEDGDISFDVVPAANLLSPEHDSLTRTEQTKVQTERALKLISENPEKDSSYYASSMAENTIKFVKKQSPFVHDVIRLAKLWNSKVDLLYLSGRSMMIELVALSVARKEEGSGEVPSISSAFQAFLEKFTDFNQNMDVFFDYPVNPNIHVVRQKYLEQKKERPVILDPVNPYNNFAVNVNPAMKSTLSVKATEILKYIRKDNIVAVMQFFDD